MHLDLEAIGAGLTQAELAERLHVSAQSVSHRERGESLPDAATLPDLACILCCPVDALPGGYSGAFRRRVTVEDMRQAIGCIRRLQELLGADHFMVRTMLDALDARMSSRLEEAFASPGAMDAYVCEALLACAENGDYVDITDVQRGIRSEKARDFTLQRLKALGLQ